MINCGVMHFNVAAYTALPPAMLDFADSRKWTLLHDQDLVEQFFKSPAAAKWREPWHVLTPLPDAYNYKVGRGGCWRAAVEPAAGPPALACTPASQSPPAPCTLLAPAGVLGRARGGLDGPVPAPGGDEGGDQPAGRPLPGAAVQAHTCPEPHPTLRCSLTQVTDVAIVHTHGPKPEMSLCVIEYLNKNIRKKQGWEPRHVIHR